MNWKEHLEKGIALFDVPLFSIGGTQVTAATALTFVVIVALTFWLSRLSRRALKRLLARRQVVDPGTLAALDVLLHYTVLFVGLGAGLHTVGINLTALFAAGAVFAVAIGFAMQNLTSNFVSGVILLLERAIKPGDILEIEGQLLEVRRMGIRATVARTLDEEDIVIPNSHLVQSPVKNYTLEDSLYRLRAQVGVAYSSDLADVVETLQTVAEAIPWRAETPVPRVLLTAFGTSSVDFEVSVWMADPWRMRARRSELYLAIWNAFQERGIVIAFPQLDLHLDEVVNQSLVRLSAAS